MDVKTTFLNTNLVEKVYMTQLNGLYKVIVTNYASFKNLSMDWSTHLGVGTSALMRQSKDLISTKCEWTLCTQEG